MPKIVVLSFVSLDGVMQAPGGPDEDQTGGFKYGGWCFPFFDEAMGSVMEEQMAGTYDLLLGRKTYEIFASFWPDHESEWPGVNAKKKYVASHTLTSPTWENTVVLREDVVDQLERIKKEDGPDLQVHGSGNLVQTLLRHDLVDELWLKIHPVLLGSGKRLFESGTVPRSFVMANSTVTPKGVVVANYRRAGEVQTGSFA